MTTVEKRSPQAAGKQRLGNSGEQLAAEILERDGMVVLARNWRCREGELDLVAVDHGTLVFCEVKTRAGDDFGDPSEAVTSRKAARIRRLARAWLAEHRMYWPKVRFDVVSVLWPPGGPVVVRHLMGAF